MRYQDLLANEQVQEQEFEDDTPPPYIENEDLPPAPQYTLEDEVVPDVLPQMPQCDK